MRSLKGHGHWVNTLALSAEFALRTGGFDHTGAAPAKPAAARAQALQRCGFGFQGFRVMILTRPPPHPRSRPPCARRRCRGAGTDFRV